MELWFCKSSESKGIILTILIVMTMTSVMSTPTKMASNLVISSIAMSMMTYTNSTSVFYAMCLIISFSSGMMILFCYTTNLSNFESKMSNKVKFNSLLTITLLVVMSYSQLNQPTITQKMQGLHFSLMPVMCFMMGFIILSMKSINQAMMGTSKSMMTSY